MRTPNGSWDNSVSVVVGLEADRPWFVY